MSLTKKIASSASLATISLSMGLSNANAQDVDNSEATDAVAPDGDLARPAAWRAELSAGAQEKSAKISLDLLQLGTLVGADSEATFASDTALNFSVSTPWDKKVDALPASLDGLANGTKLSLGYTFLGSRRHPGISDVQSAIWQEAIEKCLKDKGRKIGATPKNYTKVCSSENDSATLIFSDYISARKQRAYTTGSFDGGVHSLGVSASVAFQDFKFADPTELAVGNIKAKTVSETGWSASAKYAYYFPKTATSLGLSAEYESAWKGATAVPLCPNADGLVILSCTELAPNSPKNKVATKFSTNLRHRFFFKEELSNLAISPRVTYAIVKNDKNVWGVEFPVYLIPNGKGGLTGGVKVGYRSDTKDPTFGVFVGSAFGIVQ